MKKKLFYSLSFLSLVSLSALQSCGGAKKEETTTTDSTKVVEAPKPGFADLCKDENAITVTVKGYKMGEKTDYVFETPKFEVKESSWSITSDSTAELKLSNYSAADLVGDRKDDQVDILASFRTKGGKKIEAGTYANSDYKAAQNCTVTMTTSKGTVYFNWIMYMPESGTVTLNFADEKGVCGKFTLAAEKPDNNRIGTVRINGTFKAGK